jgi:uncharacterized membrane protein
MLPRRRGGSGGVRLAGDAPGLRDADGVAMSSGAPAQDGRRGQERRSRELSRVESFSDGVFAIAATLLVLNLGVRVANHSLAHELLAIWPSYAAYAVSFLVIAIIWMNHHAMVNRLTGLSHVFLFGNLILLMVVAFIPFPTAILAEYFRSDGTAASAFYGATMTFVGVSFSLLQTYALRSPICDIRADEARGLIARSWLGPPIYAGATAVALLSPTASLIIYAVVALFFVFPFQASGRA